MGEVNTNNSNDKVIKGRLKKIRFLRKLSNKIISRAPKNLDCYQLKKLLYKNYSKMQGKLEMFVNASTASNRKKGRPLKKQYIDLNNTMNYDFYDSDDSSNIISETDEELHELEPKNVRVKETLRKITRLRKLPDYKKIEKLLNTDTLLMMKRKRSLNSITRAKPQTPFWNTYTYLLKEIENCMANKQWNKLTSLLIYLSSAVKKCEPILLKATVINFISNRSSQFHELLDGFLKECFSCRSDEDIDRLLTQLFHITPKTNAFI